MERCMVLIVILMLMLHAEVATRPRQKISYGTFLIEQQGTALSIRTEVPCMQRPNDLRVITYGAFLKLLRYLHAGSMSLPGKHWRVRKQFWYG